jgi:hypothetical protein
VFGYWLFSFFFITYNFSIQKFYYPPAISSNIILMSDEYYRNVRLGVQLYKYVHYLGTRLCVEVSRGFICQDYGRVVYKGPRESWLE